MEKRNRKDRYIFTIILFVIFLFLLFPLYHLYKENNNLNNDIKIIKEELNKYNKELDDKEKEINQLNDDIIFYNDLINQSKNIKQEYINKIVLLEDKIMNNESDIKIAYLTFDDGPYLATSNLFLDFLEENDIKATFFYLEKGEETYPIYQRIIDSGHTLANHSASHRLSPENSIYRSVEIFKEDVLENKRFIQNNFNYTTNVFRFPGGSPQAGGLLNECIGAIRDLGYGYIDWDITTGDGKNSGTVEEYIHGVIDNYQPYKICTVLMHDYSNNTLTALPTIVETLRNDNYIFLPLFYESHKIKK